MTKYLLTVLDHYEFAGDHLKDAKGYEAYGDAVEAIRAFGKEGMAAGYLDVTAWGTPEQIIEKYQKRYELLGDFDINPCFRFGGISYEEAERSMRTFAKHVMPVLKDWDARKAA